jgi:hypothetical protein
MVAHYQLLGYVAAMENPANKVPNDTSGEAEKTYLKLLRETPLWRKAAMVDSLTQSCQELAIAGIRMRHPNASEREVLMHLAALWIDRYLMLRVFQWDPERKGY